MTKALARIDEQIELFGGDEGCFRAEILVSVRNFRSSWLNLGRHLVQVAYGGDYKEWGYEDFETYCARELGIKRTTVKKLMVSYNYLKIHEPKRLDAINDGDGRLLPSYDTLDKLSRARDAEDVDKEKLREIHAEVFEGELSATEAKEKIKDVLAPRLPGTEGGMERARELSDILRASRALRKKLVHSTVVPDGLKSRLEEVLVEMEAVD